MPETLLVAEDLHVSYGKATVLHGVSFEVNAGEVVSLLGRNGTGKTTTLRSIAGVLSPDEGSVVFDGDEIASLPDYVISNRGISYVTEERNIFPDLTVEENLKMGGVRGEDGFFHLSDVYELLPRLEERRSYKASDLSGGEQQMLVIARALLGRTKLLLLDEPTEGLAPQIIEDVLDVIKHISEQNVPILLVEQNLNTVTEVADRNYIINKGRIVYEGTTDELRDAGEIQEQYLGVGIQTEDIF